MRDKTPDPVAESRAPVFGLAGGSILGLEGPDAVRFAQAQFMSDAAALPVGHWHWSGWLTPKGRLIALFALLKRDPQTLLLWLPDADADTADALVARLQRFVFRSKLRMVRTPLHAGGAFAAPARAAGDLLADGGDALELDLGADGGPRTLRIGPHAAPFDADAERRWRAFDLAHGLPRLDADQRERWTPQQLSLDRLRAYSVRKGCYPGQEIVARTHFLGQAKRGLVRLRGAGVAELDEVMAGGPPADGSATVRPIGELVVAAGTEGLAVLPLDAGDGPFHTGGAACERLPLLAGLARPLAAADGTDPAAT